MKTHLLLILAVFAAVVDSRADDSAWVVSRTELFPPTVSAVSASAAIDCQLWKSLRYLPWFNNINDICWQLGTDSLWAVGRGYYGPDGPVTEDANPVICRSTDGGYHWEIDQPEFDSDSIPQANVILYTVQFVDAQVGFAAGGASAPGGAGPTTAVVYRTGDGGLTWELAYEGALGPFYPRHVITDIHFADAFHGWAVGAIDQFTNVAIVHTSDGGATWAPQTSGINAAVGDVDFVDASLGYAVANLGYTLRTVDGGSQWTIASQIPSFNDGTLGMEALGDSICVAANLGTLILRTEDAGASWGIVYDAPRQLFAMDATDSQTGWAVGQYGVIVRTVDGGVTWDQVVSPPNVPYLFGVAAKNADEAWMCGVGTIGYTLDAGATWRHVDGAGYITSATLYDIEFVDAERGWMVGQQGEMVRTIDRGATWTHDFGITGNIEAIDFADDSNGWVATTTSVWRTADGGASWYQQETFPNSLIDVHFRSGSHGWLSGTHGAVYRTDDGGVTWDSLSTDTTEALYSLSFVSDTIGWVVGWNGTILRTDDGGDGWQPQVAPTMDPCYSVCFVDEDHGWIAALKGIYGTTDGGQMWVSQHTQASTGLSAVDFIDANNGIAVGGRVNLSQILVTDDGGTTWTECGTNKDGLSLGLGQKLLGAVMLDDDLAYAAGSEGWVVQIGEGPSAVNDPSPRLPNGLQLLTARPNPFSRVTRIAFRIAKPADVTIEIFDVAGRRVFRETVVGLPAGDNTFLFDGVSADGTPLPSGVYFQRVTALGTRQASKMVIVR